MILVELDRVRVLQLIGFETLAPSDSFHPPSAEHPEIDDRLPGQYEVGAIWNSTIEVRLRRLAIAPDAVLTARSSAGHLTVTNLTDGHLPSGDAVLRIQVGAAPNDDDTTNDALEVYWENHLIGKLDFYVYKLLRVTMHFYFCMALRSSERSTTQDPNNAPRRRELDGYPNRYIFLTPVFAVVNAIWRSAGVEFVPVSGTDWGTSLHHDGDVVVGSMTEEDMPYLVGVSPEADVPRDRATFLSAVPAAAGSERGVNIYLVHCIGDAETGPVPNSATQRRAITLAVTSPAFEGDQPGDARPCIFVPLYTPSTDGGRSAIWTTQDHYDEEGHVVASALAPELWMGSSLAHELGHFFGLLHPADLPHGEYLHYDASKRLLMHNNSEGFYLIPHVGLYDPSRLNDNGVWRARRNINAHLHGAVQTRSARMG